MRKPAMIGLSKVSSNLVSGVIANSNINLLRQQYPTICLLPEVKLYFETQLAQSYGSSNFYVAALTLPVYSDLASGISCKSLYSLQR